MAVRQMIGIVKQTITELEHGLRPDTPSHDKWKKTIASGVIASLIAAFIWWVVIPYLDAWRNAGQQQSPAPMQQKEKTAKQPKEGATKP